MKRAGESTMAFFFKYKRLQRILLVTAVMAVSIPPVLYGGCEPPQRSQPLQARLELAAGEVTVEREGTSKLAFSGAALLPDSQVKTGAGARALVRLSNGSAVFLRGGSEIGLGSNRVDLSAGEVWLDAPPTDREALVLRLGEVSVHAVDAGVSLLNEGGSAKVYVARGMATVTAPGGRVEVQAGEQAIVSGGSAPSVEPVAFWEDWTGGMADHQVVGGLAGAGSGRIYGVDLGAPKGTPAQALEISRQSVRAVIRAGLAETQVDQTFFNPGDRPVEGWYWFTVPSDASITGFAVETNGMLVEGEFIEKREAAAQYGRAVASGHAPALLEWVDSRTFRARIYPVPATGTRRVVLRYLQLMPVDGGTLRYVYPLQSAKPVKIGEFSLAVDLGEQGQNMSITTLADARVEQGGMLVTMRRSGYTPRSDFMLEAELDSAPEALRMSRAGAGGATADYVMVRYTPDIDWSKVKELKGDVVVVVDTSAASDEASRSMKAAAAEAILRALSESDRFALVSLDVRPKVLHPADGLASASDAEIGQALEKLADHASGGATDLSALFDVALARLHGAEQPAVIYVGDGIATSGEMRGEQLAERLRRALSTSRARLFTVAVGPHADRALLGTLAQAGGGQAYQIETAQAATERALNLVAALKTPTMTDFEIELGAGLDEVMISANGKVVSGEEVIILARTHHDLPPQVTVKGRLAGEQFESSYTVALDEPTVSTFVPRLWAAEYLRRLIGAAGDPGAHRGKIMQMGIQYGLMTPFTSILALESEAAYQQQGIPRRHSPLRGMRLGALVDGQRGRDSALRRTTNAVGFGCTKSYDEAPMESAQAPVAATQQQKGMRDFAQREASRVARPDEGMAVGSAGSGPGGLKGRMPAKKAMAKPSPVDAEETDDMGGLEAKEQEAARPETRKDSDRAGRFQQACSDTSRRPIRQRVILWSKRMRTARTPQDLIHRYQAAWHACELPDWRSEATFFRVMQRYIKDEATAAFVLAFFAKQPETQRYLARLILRRTVDARVIAVVEKLLFKGKVNWATVDIELSEIADVDGRIERLRQIAKKAPADPNGIIRMVHLLVLSNRMEEALVQGRRLRDAGLTTPFLARELGDVLAQHEHAAEAVRTYSEIVEFDPASLPSRQLLGDIYLAHGWYDPAYRQFKTLTERAPDEPLFQLRLAASAAGAGRVDEALRLERSVARAPGRPGSGDPRRWAKLWSAARLARLLHTPPKKSTPKLADSLKSKLKELQLFRGPGTLVLLTWEDLSADLELAVEGAGAGGEAMDASRTGAFGLLLSGVDSEKTALKAFRRNPSGKYPVALKRQAISWDGKSFSVEVSDHVLPPGASNIALMQ